MPSKTLLLVSLWIVRFWRAQTLFHTSDCQDLVQDRAQYMQNVSDGRMFLNGRFLKDNVLECHFFRRLSVVELFRSLKSDSPPCEADSAPRSCPLRVDGSVGAGVKSSCPGF